MENCRYRETELDCAQRCRKWPTHFTWRRVDCPTYHWSNQKNHSARSSHASLFPKFINADANVWSGGINLEPFSRQFDNTIFTSLIFKWLWASRSLFRRSFSAQFMQIIDKAEFSLFSLRVIASKWKVADLRNQNLILYGLVGGVLFALQFYFGSFECHFRSGWSTFWRHAV